jgi:hypothetical protein
MTQALYAHMNNKRKMKKKIKIFFLFQLKLFGETYEESAKVTKSLCFILLGSLE